VIAPPPRDQARRKLVVNPMFESITADAPHDIARPVMLQGWYDLTALHWRYQPAEVQALLPRGFVVDTFDGSAWVGLIPFHMHRIRVPGLPPFGSLSSFPETNIRTYIIDATGRRGVWFLSLDITRLLPTFVARIGYHLPYYWSAMAIAGEGHGDGATRRYTSRRRRPSVEATSHVSVRIGRPITGRDLTELDHFLTARWALGTTFGRKLMWAKISHPPWPIHAAEVLECDESLVEAAGLRPPDGEPVVRWSPGVEVRIGVPRSIRWGTSSLTTREASR
jgi:uncharacterized protein